MSYNQNLASGTLDESISASDTTLTVYVGEGSSSVIEGVWPTAPFYATIMPAVPAAGVPNSLDSEIVLVTAVSNSNGSTVLTVTRGQKGTSAKLFSAGDIVTNAMYANDAVLLGSPVSGTNMTQLLDKDGNDVYPYTQGTGGGNPTGAIITFAGSSAPSGYLLCDGSAVSRTTYADLFTVIGTTYGTGDGSTTFNVPNLKGRVPVGRDASDTSFDVLGETGGEKSHKLIVSEMPSHTHRISCQRGTPGNSSWDYAQPGTGWNTSAWNPNPTEPIGGNGYHNNLQPYIVLNYVIKY